MGDIFEAQRYLTRSWPVRYISIVIIHNIFLVSISGVLLESMSPFDMYRPTVNLTPISRSFIGPSLATASQRFVDNDTCASDWNSMLTSATAKQLCWLAVRLVL